MAGEAGPTGAAGNGGPAGTSGIAGTGVAGAGPAGTSGAAGMGAAGTGAACTSPAKAHMSWLLAHDASGPEITCESVGATTVTILMNSRASNFPCNAKSGTTVDLPAGMYTPRVLVANAAGTALSQGNLADVAVPSCGVVELGKIRFLVSANTGAAGTSGAAGSGAVAGSGGGAGTNGAAGTGAAGSGAAGFMGGTGPCDAMPIFTMHSCAFNMACHDAMGSAANFDMVTSGWEKMLVGRTARPGGKQGIGSACLGVNTPYLVAGSKPAKGLFLDKLGIYLDPKQTKPVCGDRMPLLPPQLSPQEMDCIQRWANGITSK
jgi:hypothetical protein